MTGSTSNNGIAIDGAGNIYTANEASYSLNSVNSGFINVFSKSGVNLVPGYGITRPANSSEFSSTLVQNTVVMGTSNSVAVDISGNLWVVNSFQNMFDSTGQQYTATVFVGAAVPVVSSIAYALSQNAVGTMP